MNKEDISTHHQDIPLIEISNITKTFPGVLALDNVSFSINKGEVHALLGENGAGKSTLIKLMTGVFTQDKGEFLINGEIVNISDPNHAIKLCISAIYQDPTLIGHLSIEQNILLGREPRSGIFIKNKQLHEQAAKVMSDLGLNLDLNQKVVSLNPGHKQLVCIAKALSIDAQLLIMDEPSASLTDEEISYLFEIICKLRRQGISIIYVSHRIEEIFQIADRATILRDGKYIGTRKVSETTKTELVNMIVGRDLEINTHKRRPPSDEIALRVDNISSKKLFKKISFSVRSGEILALSGLIGSGRSEVARAIFGATRYDQGQIHIYGIAVTTHSPKEAIKNGIHMVPEDRKAQGIIGGMSLLENVTLSNLQNYSRFSLIQSAKESRSVNNQIQQMRINPADPRRKVMFLSGGNQQKTVLAKVLDTKPRILILDEPTAGVDVGSKVEIRSLINDLADAGNAILLISSEIPEILSLADRTIVMKEGQISGELAGEEMTSENIMHLAMAEEAVQAT